MYMYLTEADSCISKVILLALFMTRCKISRVTYARQHNFEICICIYKYMNICICKLKLSSPTTIL